MLLNITGCSENGHRDDCTFLIGVHEMKLTYVRTSFSVSPTHPDCSISIPLTWLRRSKRCNGCNGNYQCGQVTATVHSRNFTLLLNFCFSPKWSFWEHSRAGPRILNNCCSNTMPQGAMHLIQLYVADVCDAWERWIKFLLHFVFCNLVQGVGCLCLG